jgi:hypothetical protein
MDDPIAPPPITTTSDFIARLAYAYLVRTLYTAILDFGSLLMIGFLGKPARTRWMTRHGATLPEVNDQFDATKARIPRSVAKSHHQPHAEERSAGARLEAWARAPRLKPTLRDGRDAASSG